MAKFTRAEVRNILGEAHTEEIENKLVALHLGVIDPMKDELANAKAEIEKLDSVQKELDNLKKQAAETEDWKAKFEKEHADFDEYKGKVDKDKQEANIKTLYRALLKENRVDEKRIDSIIKVTDFSSMKVDKDGKLDGADKLSEAIKTDWKDFIFTTKEKGTDVETPPAEDGKKMTKEEIFKIKDTTKRQEAIAQNIDLFE